MKAKKTNSSLSHTAQGGKEILNTTKDNIKKRTIELLMLLALNGSMSSCGDSSQPSKDQTYAQLSQMHTDLEKFRKKADEKLSDFSPGTTLTAKIGDKVVTVFDYKRKTLDYTDFVEYKELHISIKDGVHENKALICRYYGDEEIEEGKSILFSMSTDGVAICHDKIADSDENFKDPKTNEYMSYVLGLTKKALLQSDTVIYQEYQKHKKEVDQIKIKHDSLLQAKKAKEKEAREYLNRTIKAKK